MSFSVDQFMQVKCKLALTSDHETETIQTIDNEKIRLCTSVHDRTSTIIVMICSNHASNNNILTYYVEKRNKPTKPRIKQIFYHHYNEDIVAIALSETGNKLALINSSSTIYLLPIKNILLRSSQCKSMYFYDASIINCCSIENPIALVYWETLTGSSVIVAGEDGKISFINVEDKKEINTTHVNDRIQRMELIKDMCSYSLLITCDNFKQYRYTLKIIKAQENQKQLFSDEYICLEKEVTESWNRKPIPIKLHSGNMGTNGATAAIHRVLVPSGRGGGSHSANLFAGREHSIPSIFYHSTVNLISVVDILGASKQRTSNNNLATSNLSEPRLLRFFSNKQFYYRPLKPSIISKIHSLDPDEKITHLVLTDRFIAIATDRDRCLINSRNCCNSKNPHPTIELDSLIKDVSFNNDERILLLLKSPVSNDLDNIIDSFLLVTSKSIYSIEARQSCRDMYINLIDSHLGIKPPRIKKNFIENLSSNSSNPNEYIMVDDYRAQRKYSESNIMVTNFLCHRDEVYERINYDTKAFSILFKLEFNSLYEAYGDKLMIRNQFNLANRFFQLAKFDHSKTLGKYIRLGALNETINYVTSILSDENEILDEKERIDLARAAFECLLAKTIVERSKVTLYKNKISRNKLKSLIEQVDNRRLSNPNTPVKPLESSISSKQIIFPMSNQPDMFKICDHSPRGYLNKLSGNTIIASINDDDDEATLTHEGNEASKVDRKLECEKALINFVKQFVPSSLYSYALAQFVDFGLIDLANTISHSDSKILILMRIILKSKDEHRILFRDGRFETSIEKLKRLNYNDLIKTEGPEPKFLEFITSPEVIKVLVKDINLTSEYLGYQKTTVQFRKYSFTALHLLDSFRKLVMYQLGTIKKSKQINPDEQYTLFTQEHKKSIKDIFLEFMKVSLDESTEDSCKLWYNYINFYLNYVGNLDELKKGILDLINLDDTYISTSDCRLAITLYKAIGRDESNSTRPFVSEGFKNTPLENMAKLYNLADLFEVEFLTELLEKTMDIIPRSWYQLHNFSHMLVL